jgi:ethanolamine permease
MPETTPRGVTYATVDAGYFGRRSLRRHAGVFSLWALGVGIVISGQFSGWNLGMGLGGWGGMLIATLIIIVMYAGLTTSLAEMASSQPWSGGAYGYARATMGPWAGLFTGLCGVVEYVLASAAVCFFLGSYLGGIFNTPPEMQPLYWVGGYVLFVALNAAGAAMSFRITVFLTLLAISCLTIFWASAAPLVEFGRYALNIGPGGVEIPGGHGPFLPGGWMGVLAQLPFAVWLFLAIEQLPLSAEESLEPRRDVPIGLLLGMGTLAISSLAVLWLNSAAPPGAFALSSSGEPILDGLRAIFGDADGRMLALVAVAGLVASLHACVYAYSRQIFGLSRAGYLPGALSLTSVGRGSPDLALAVGATVALGVMLALWFAMGPERASERLGQLLLNMSVLGAMISYVMQGLSFIILRRTRPDLPRPFRSPLGVAGAAATILIALVTIVFQLRDPAFRTGLIGVGVCLALGAGWFWLVGRHSLTRSPEEVFALSGESGAAAPDAEG